MAFQTEVSDGWKKKRKIENNNPKLIVGDKVEVRSREEGLKGSWHVGTVIAREKQARRVKYEHLLCDNESEMLTERVRVSSIVDGIVSNNMTQSHCRGLIRPLPPLLHVAEWSPHYAQCVDVYYKEAWWEGVIFDHEDGSEQRKIFFPDTDEVMKFGIEMLRITQDWDEFTEDWKPRGNWLFLEFIEELEPEWPLQVSVRQMWYDLQGKEGFVKLKEWICSARSIWEDLVLDVLNDNFKLTLDEFFLKLDPPEGLVQESQQALELSEPHDVVPFQDDGSETGLLPPTNPTNASVPSQEDIDWGFMEEGGLDFNLPTSSKMPCPEEILCEEPPASSSPLLNPGNFRIYSKRKDAKDLLRKKPTVRKEIAVKRPRQYIDVEPEYCPQAVWNYYLLTLRDKDDHYSKRKESKDLIPIVKKHLSFIGWKFFAAWKQARWELRYQSPSKVYYSLREACRCYINEGGLSGFGVSTSRPEQTTSANEDAEQLAGDKPSSPLIGEMKGNLLLQNALPENWATEPSSLSPSRKLIELDEVEVQGIRELQKEKKSNELDFASHLLHKEDQNARSQILKNGQESKNSSFKLTRDSDDDSPKSVPLSRKRVKKVEVPSSSYHGSRTVLSWLIDKGVVLPGAKVHYRNKKDHHSMAEGQITRDGILCSCCQNFFTLTKFEAHAGSTYHRPSANIFLEDGRSLSECQLQLKSNDNSRSFITDTHEMNGKRHHKANDRICYVCNFGGTLILCDQCPSSFHTHCLGLKDIPEGDWFCPSCCCGICHESKFDQDAKQLENSVLICDQCEHQYHAGCLRKLGLMQLDSNPEGNWFCNKNCEQIFISLRKLLGKPVSLGKDDLTLTLLKYTKRDKDDASDYDASLENNNKLVDALGLMHECFKPLKEFRSRDLVEDVIFSRCSGLRRLNFKGFYTFILEGYDELITAAAVRIYGKKVAEVPLVGTRSDFRNRGMCHILMNGLEKMLMDLGIERLVLPAVPGVVNSWITSFGFSKMTKSERHSFLDYTFLEFQDIIMCQKLLTRIPSAEPSLLEGTQQQFYEDVNGGDNDIDIDRNCADELFQADQMEATEIEDQCQVQYVSPLISSVLCGLN
ncbi:uncharacterized protein LOC132309570 [Cornus florida]|uniref:uncharacterized protein LOC132309570 n=1 Tax=Cornus florida TaxID=4283 RepID=UPI00289C2B5A|nr:uncharacterized protein LOC132309570 [Cornus florida]